MKRFYHHLAVMAAAAAVSAMFLAGCAQREEFQTVEEAVNGGAVLGENINIDGLDVSGMGVLEARKLLRAEQQKRVDAFEITFSAGERSHTVRGNELRIEFNTDQVLLEALALPPKKLFAEPEERKLSCAASVPAGAASRCASEAAAALDAAPVDAVASFDPEAGGGFTYTQDQTGISTDIAALALVITQRATTLEGGALEAEHAVLDAQYTLSDAMNDTQLIAEFTTSFKGSTYSKENRVFNIKKAAGLIDGVMLENAEEFSINSTLGPRTEKNGWREATGIRDGAYVQEYGGGVCQVSTTLYNALLMADLKITQRSHHSWPLGYVDIGRDATISTGGPDLCFVNTSGARLFIRAFTDTKNKSITVRLYGRALANGVTIRVTSSKTQTLEDLGTEILTDTSLAPGEEKIVREARRGSMSETYKEYYAADGTLVDRVLVSRDKYRSIKGLMYIGPAVAATPSPQPSPDAGVTPSPEQTPDDNGQNGEDGRNYAYSSSSRKE